MVAIDLVYPKLDADYKNLVSGYSVFPPPSGLEIIASYIQNNFQDAKISIWDGQFFNDVIQNLSGDFVGISDWFSNHENAMNIAKKAKRKNSKCKIIIGGPNASNLNKRILDNHPYIDYVCGGDGEESLLGIIGLKEGKTSLENIPNLWHRNSKGESCFTYYKNISLNILPNFDFGHLSKSNLKKYDSRKENYAFDLDRTPITLSSIRGCLKASKLGKCSYCSLPLKGIRLMNPKKVWSQIQSLNKKYGINSFFETGDNLVVGDYPLRLLDKKPKDLNVTFRAYASPDSITSEVGETLRKLGVKEIFMGVENISPEILRRTNKFYDTTRVENSIRNCEVNGIGVFLPFLFGLPGETEMTAKKNHEFAHYLSEKYFNINRILYSLAVPVIGCSWFELLTKDKEIINKYPDILHTDKINYPLLTKLSIQKNCKIKLEELLDIVNSPPRLDKNRIASYGDIANKLL